jgi:hypothetical protein
MPVISTTRGSITVQVGERTARVFGEMWAQTLGEPDYMIWTDELKAWEPPFDKLPLSEEDKRAILAEVVEYLTSIGRVPKLVPE